MLLSSSSFCTFHEGVYEFYNTKLEQDGSLSSIKSMENLRDCALFLDSTWSIVVYLKKPAKFIETGIQAPYIDKAFEWNSHLILATPEESYIFELKEAELRRVLRRSR